jgi:hypothetical protein
MISLSLSRLNVIPCSSESKGLKLNTLSPSLVFATNVIPYSSESKALKRVIPCSSESKGLKRALDVLQDMISSDEDAGDESKEKWNLPPSRVQSPQVKSALEEAWVDPICKIFQIPPRTDNLAPTCHKGESSVAAAAAVEMPSTMVMVDPMVTREAEASCSHQFSLEKTIKQEIGETGPIAPSNPPAHLQSSQRSEREKFFLDMGFPIALVKSAMQQFRQYGVVYFPYFIDFFLFYTCSCSIFYFLLLQMFSYLSYRAS